MCSARDDNVCLLISLRRGIFILASSDTHTKPIRVKNPDNNDESLVRLAVNVDSSDNPMQSEICSHIGDKGNYPCRKCEVGGPQTHKQSDLGYHAFFSVRHSIASEFIFLPRDRKGLLETKTRFSLLSSLSFGCHAWASKPVSVTSRQQLALKIPLPSFGSRSCSQTPRD